MSMDWYTERLVVKASSTRTRPESVMPSLIALRSSGSGLRWTSPCRSSRSSVGHNQVMASSLFLLALGEAVIHTQGPGGAAAFTAATYAYFPALILAALPGSGPAGRDDQMARRDERRRARPASGTNQHRTTPCCREVAGPAVPHRTRRRVSGVRSPDRSSRVRPPGPATNLFAPGQSRSRESEQTRYEALIVRWATSKGDVFDPPSMCRSMARASRRSSRPAAP